MMATGCSEVPPLARRLGSNVGSARGEKVAALVVTSSNVLEIGKWETEFLHQLPGKSFPPTLPGLDAAAWGGPKASRDVEVFPGETPEQDRVILIEDERPNTHAQLHEAEVNRTHERSVMPR